MKKSIFRINRLAHFNAFAFVSASLLVLIFVATIFPITKKTERVSAAIDNSEYALALNTSTDVDINVRPTAGGKLAVAKDTVTGTTNAPSGYRLFVATETDTNDMYLNGDASTEKKIAATTGTFETPTALTVSDETTATWGYAVAGLNNFDATYNEADPSLESKFAAMPTAENEQLIHEHAGIANGDVTEIYYGTRVAASTVSGIYTTTINYISLTDISSEVTGELYVNPGALLEGTGDSEVELVTSLVTNFELGNISATIDNVSCDSVEIITQNPLRLTCSMDFSGLTVGNYDVVVNVPKLGKSYSSVGGLEIVPPNTTVAIAVSAGNLGTVTVDTPDGQGGSTSTGAVSSATATEQLYSSFTISGNVLTFADGTTVTATPITVPEGITVFSGWSDANGPLTSGSTVANMDYAITANFVRYVCNPNATSLDEAVCMQDVELSVIENTPLHQSKQLLDSRDNKLYWVTKLKDGNLWMTQNLDYDISTTSNVVSNEDGSVSVWSSNKYYNLNTFRADNNKAIGAITVFYGPQANESRDLGNVSFMNEDGTWGGMPGNGNTATNPVYCTPDNNSGEECHYHTGNLYSEYGARANNVGATSTQAPFANIDPSTDFTVTGSYSLGTDSMKKDYAEISRSICPQGWRLPADSGNENEDYTYASLAKHYYAKSGDTGYKTDNVLEAFNDPVYIFGGRESIKYVTRATTFNVTYSAYSYYNNQMPYVTMGVGDTSDYNYAAPTEYPYTRVRCVAVKTMQEIPVSTMQEITPEIVAKLPQGTSKQLLDERDGKLYWVTKMRDGNLWMTQNLDYDVATGSTDPGNVGYVAGSDTQSTINCTNSNNSGDDCHYHEGNYYDFNAATANSGTVAKNIDAEDSVCPAGWHLPSGGNYLENGSFGYLTDTYNFTDGIDSLSYRTNKMATADRSTAVASIIDGGCGSYGSYYWSAYQPNQSVCVQVVLGATPSASGSPLYLSGDYWSASQSTDSSKAYSFSGTEGSTDSSLLADRSEQKHVRCVADTALDQISTMQEMTPEIVELTPKETVKQLRDTRDNKLYWVAKTADGGMWMTQNLDYDISADTNIVSDERGGTKVWDSNATYAPENTITSLNVGESTGRGTLSYDPGNVGHIANSENETEINCSSSNNSGRDCHYHTGNYYQANAGTAGSIEAAYDSNEIASVCPQGWSLPTQILAGQTPRYESQIITLRSANKKVSMSSLLSSYLNSYGALKYHDTLWKAPSNANGLEWSLVDRLYFGRNGKVSFYTDAIVGQNEESYLLMRRSDQYKYGNISSYTKNTENTVAFWFGEYDSDYAYESSGIRYYASQNILMGAGQASMCIDSYYGYTSCGYSSTVPLTYLPTSEGLSIRCVAVVKED